MGPQKSIGGITALCPDSVQTVVSPKLIPWFGILFKKLLLKLFYLLISSGFIPSPLILCNLSNCYWWCDSWCVLHIIWWNLGYRDDQSDTKPNLVAKILATKFGFVPEWWQGKENTLNFVIENKIQFFRFFISVMVNFWNGWNWLIHSWNRTRPRLVARYQWCQLRTTLTFKCQNMLSKVGKGTIT